MALGASVVNLGYVWVVAGALAPDTRWVTGEGESLRSWLRFILWGFLGPAMAAAAAGALLTVTVFDLPMRWAVAWPIARTWYLTDVLGVGILVPTLLRIRPSLLAELRARGRLVPFFIAMATFLGMGLLVFSSPSHVAPYAPVIALPLVVFYFGIPGVAIATLTLGATALFTTVNGVGPFVGAAIQGDDSGLLSAQVYIFIVTVMAVLTAALSHEASRGRVFDAVGDDLFQMIADATGDAVLIADAEGRVQNASPFSAKLLGFSNTHIMEFGWRQHLHPDDVSVVDDALAALAAGAERQRRRIRVRHADGRWRVMDSRWKAVRRRGAPGHLVLSSYRDVTDEIAREQAVADTRRELERSATTDPLTGLLNRRGLDEVVDRLWSPPSGHGEDDVALILLDLDHFKSYNDTQGHAAGDLCLTRVAGAILRHSRERGDFACRVGGEEMAVLMAATDEHSALQVAQRLQVLLRELAIPHDATPRGIVTASMGVARARTSEESYEQLFRRTDAALYRAKAEGRDQIAAADPPAR